MTTSPLEVHDEHVTGNVGGKDQKMWQLDQGLGDVNPTATPAAKSSLMHPDVDTSPDHPPKRKKKTLIARLFTCCCPCTATDHPAAQTQQAISNAQVAPYGVGCGRRPSIDSGSSDPAQPKTPVSPQSSAPPANIAKYITRKHSSGHRAPWDHGHQQQSVATRRTYSTAMSEAPTEWTDAKSCFSNDLDDHDQDDLDALDVTAYQHQV